ncbi:Phosphofurin acidic cluster sorting protein 2 [Aphelenchoides fujianensis]|nr:Phosphofurin acidic cluster sorting protein 2 [Aphelenchoides fujianensis]
MADDSAPVAMRVFANWDVERASQFCVSRALSMILSKLTFYKPLETEHAINIAVRLQGHKRTLRSADIAVPPLGPGVQIQLDISTRTSSSESPTLWRF